MFGIEHIGKKVNFLTRTGKKGKGTLTSVSFQEEVDVREDETGIVHYSVSTKTVQLVDENEDIIPYLSIIQITAKAHYQHSKKYVVVSKFSFGEYGYIDEHGVFNTISEQACRLVGSVEEAQNIWTQALSDSSGVPIKSADFFQQKSHNSNRI